MTPYTAEQVRDAAAILQAVQHDLPKELEDRLTLMLECYADDLDARALVQSRLSQARELWASQKQH